MLGDTLGTSQVSPRRAQPLDNPVSQAGGGRLAEIDLLRMLAAMAVILLHTLGYFRGLDPVGSVANFVDQILIELLRFAREAFMLVTGLVLAYSYRRRTIDGPRFLARRTNTVFVPYAVWTVIYLLLTWGYNPQGAPAEPLLAILHSLIAGDGFYHLYYIVVSLQFYLLFPWIVGWVKRLDRRRAALSALALGLSYLGMMALYAAHPADPGITLAGPAGNILNWLSAYRDRLLVSYFPYFAFGVLAGLNYDSFRDLLVRGHRGLLGLGVLLAAYLTFDWLITVVRGGASFDAFVTVFRPAMFLYSLVMFGLLFLAAERLERARGWMADHLQTMAPYTFGIYLLHPLVLFVLEQYVMGAAPGPHALIIVPLWLVAIVLSHEAVRLAGMTPVGPVLFGTKPVPSGSGSEGRRRMVAVPHSAG